MAGHEFDIIDRYFAGRIRFTSDAVVLGMGDDCAILDIPAGKSLCVSTDTLLEGVHFPVGAPGSVAAHRSLCANLSDLAAMGATPLGFTLALTLPAENVDWLEQFSARLCQLTEKYEIPLVGGNLARGQLSITITVMGTVPAGAAIPRSGASAGDDVYVSGTLGDAAAGLRLLGSVADDDPLVWRYLFPEPRLAVGQAIVSRASAAIDISDGLIADLGHICLASGVGARIELARIPVNPLVPGQFNDTERVAMVTAGGDDYELCFTANPSARVEIQRIAARLQLPLTLIGETTGEIPEILLVDQDGAPVELTTTGYQHFS
ncbi:MAG: thiamine-phosphate kinase [Pseudomonadota bacterium]